MQRYCVLKQYSEFSFYDIMVVVSLPRTSNLDCTKWHVKLLKNGLENSLQFNQVAS